MKKKVVQDVIPPKRSIRNIELPSKSRRVKEVEPDMETRKIPEEAFVRPVNLNKQIPPLGQPSVTARPPEGPKEPAAPKYTYAYDEPKKSSRKWLYIAVAILVLVVAFAISALFKGATITVTPKQLSKFLNASFVAKKDSTQNDLGYQVVSVTKEVSKTVPAGVEQRVEKKATGTITIYNNYSATPQKLVATTRFQTPEGLIFRLTNPTTVPGKTTASGKSVAGSVDATVTADAAGASYNIGLKDFTIPGFKGDPKYTTVYARSKTEMTGGFSGMQKTASGADMASANTELEATLRDSLAKDIVTQIPANFVLYKNSISYSLAPISQVDSSTEGAVLQKKGTIMAIIFDKGMLSRTIFNKVAPEVANDMVKITNLDSLGFTYASSTNFSPTTSTSVTFSLVGSANLVWVFDENKLKSDLLGLSKSNAKTVISTYPAIKEAWVETRPFWNQTIPSDPEKVTLVNTVTP